MPHRAWIIRNGYQWVVDAKPRGSRDWPRGFQSLEHVVGLPVGYAPPIVDDLTWGPHHPNLTTQRLLRLTYHRSTLDDDERAMELCLEALGRGDELLLWTDARLGSCLSALWVLDWLHTRNGDLGRVSLIVQPGLWAAPVSVETFQALYAARTPVEGLASTLIAARHHLASDSDEIAVDGSSLSTEVREWVEQGNHLRDLFPDERGLDRFDDRLLEHLSDDWQRGSWPVGNALMLSPEHLGAPGQQLWQRLVELSDQAGVQSVYADIERGNRALCELRTKGWGTMVNSRVRITRLGKSVRSGRSDAIKHRQFHRWVGGRLLTNDRLIRRPGSYRDKRNRGSLDPESLPSNEIQ